MPGKVLPMEKQDIRALAQVSCRLAFGGTPPIFDIVYMHGLSSGMIASCDLFQLAVAESRGSACPIAFNGDPAEQARTRGWMGAEGYRSMLCRLGVRSTNLLPTAPGLHTRSECDEFVLLAKQKGYRSVSIVTVPYHWPRVMACLVGSMVMHDHRVAAFFARPHRIKWDMPMVGSQGKVKDSTFLQEAGGEVERFCDYLERGRALGGVAWKQAWGAPIDEIMEYLEWRDA